MMYELQPDFEPFALAATAALEDQEGLAGLFVMVRRYRQLITPAFEAFHVKTAERAVRAGFSRFIFLFPHEPALRVDWHGATITERVGQRLSKLINWFYGNGALLPITRNFGLLGDLQA